MDHSHTKYSQFSSARLGYSQKTSNTLKNNFYGQVFSILIKVQAIIVMLFVISCIANAQALPQQSKQTISAEYLMGTGDMHGTRLAYRPEFHRDFNLPIVGDFRLSWELSANFYDLHGSANTETTYGLSVSPIFTKAIPSWSTNYPLSVEFGIGVAYVHDEKFGGEDIGSSYQFEDRIALLMGLDEKRTSELALRYLHYSNGGFNTENPGLDYLSLAYLYHF